MHPANGWISPNVPATGLTMTWNGQKSRSGNGAVINLNTAYMDATDEKDFTAGINGLWRKFELGYIYAHNEIDKFDTASFNAGL